MEDHKAIKSPFIAKLNSVFEPFLMLIQAVALLIITISTAVAIVLEGWEMYETRSIGLANLLLLFLFIEILSMVRQYSLGQHELKLRTPLVITIVAVARYLIINMEHLTGKVILITSIAILILTIALFIARFIRGLYSEEAEEKFATDILKKTLCSHCGKDKPCDIDGCLLASELREKLKNFSPEDYKGQKDEVQDKKEASQVKA